MQDSAAPPPNENGTIPSSGGGKDAVATPPPPGGTSDTCIGEGLDPKMTVMGGGEKEKAADFANCESLNRTHGRTSRVMIWIRVSA